jgi:ribosomal protein S18 acetylase RimI-like enzyme
MHTRAVRNGGLGKTIVVRPLQHGDTATILALFQRMSDASRAARFHGAKPRLRDEELVMLSSVGPDRHVLVAWVEGDPAPAASARLVRNADDVRAAEIAFEVADCYQGRGVATALVEMLLEDARGAGITHVEGLVQHSNRAALALLRRVLVHVTLRDQDGAILVSSA